MSMSLFQGKLSFQKWKINKLTDNNTFLEINLKNLASNLDFLKSKIKFTDISKKMNKIVSLKSFKKYKKIKPKNIDEIIKMNSKIKNKIEFLMKI